MILDHVLTYREFHWLGSGQDKVAHFLTTTSLGREALPRLAFGAEPHITVRHFPDKLPHWRVRRRSEARLSLPPGEPVATGLSALPCGGMRNSCARCRRGPCNSWFRSTSRTRTAAREAPYRALRERVQAGARHAARSRDGKRAALVLGGACPFGTAVAEDKRMRRARRILGRPGFRALRRVLKSMDTAPSMSPRRDVCRGDRPRRGSD